MNRRDLKNKYKSEYINMNDIVDIVLAYFNKDRDYLFSKSRKREVVLVRQICHYFGQKYVIDTLENIGNIGGGKDHATCLHSITSINNYIFSSYRPIIIDLENIEHKIKKFINPDIIFRNISKLEIKETNIINFLQIEIKREEFECNICSNLKNNTCLKTPYDNLPGFPFKKIKCNKYNKQNYERTCKNTKKSYSVSHQ